MATRNISALVLGTFILSSTSFAEIEKRVSCPKADVMVVNSYRSVEDFKDFLEANRILLKGRPADAYDLEKFQYEYNKFPESLREEMLENYSTLHLITGHGVTDDQTWDSRDVTTFDGRPWSEVPGAGGAPYMTVNQKESYERELGYIRDMQKYCSHPRVNCDKDWTNEKPKTVIKDHPTRIVVNNLYTRHGSVNLFLHEQAHSLDSLYSSGGVSKSLEWKNLVVSSEAQEYMKVVCTSIDYCLKNDNEAFAELFAYYHACDGTREHMERNAPNVASYFQNLTRIKEKPAKPRYQAKPDTDVKYSENDEVPKKPKKKFRFSLPKIKIPKLDFDIFG